MKLAKRLLATIIAVAMLAGCAAKPAPASSTPAPSTEVPSSVAPSTPAPEEKPYSSLDDFVLYDAEGKTLRTGRDATGKTGVVSTSKYEASKIGVEILENGGNAVDAAVAVGFALGLVDSGMNGLGGGGFMNIRDGKTGEVVFIDFREKAASTATPDMWQKDVDGKVIGNQKLVGGKASGVPGEVAGLLYALEHYGTMDRAKIMQPTIDLARSGITVTPNLANGIKNSYDKLSRFGAEDIHLKNVDGMYLPYEIGDIFKNPDLAKSLELIRDKGADVFYKGEIAEAVVAANQTYGGLLTMKDMADFEVRVLEPIRGTYRGYEIISSPPPSSGGATIIEILNILENFDIPALKQGSAEEVHLFIEACKLAYADRGAYMGDPNYVKVPLKGMTDKAYAKTLAAKIDPKKAMQPPKADDPWAYESTETLHFSVADKDGNIVAVTKTLNMGWGSGVGVKGYGFVLNNQMDDFVYGPDHPNSIAGGKVPLSSMSPTIILKDGKPFAVLGSPGGTTIISTVAQVISNLIDHNMGMQDAINAPRISSGVFTTMDISAELEMPKEVKDTLTALGHVIKDTEKIGNTQGVLYIADGTLAGGADWRGDGKALGY